MNAGAYDGEIKDVIDSVEYLDENGQIDFQKAQIISFDPSFNAYRVIGECVGQAFKDGFKLK